MTAPHDPASPGPSFAPPASPTPYPPPAPYPSPAPSTPPPPVTADFQTTGWASGQEWVPPPPPAAVVKKPGVGFAIIAWFQLIIGGLLALAIFISAIRRLSENPRDDSAELAGNLTATVFLLGVFAALPITTGICTLVLRSRLMTAWQNQRPF